MKSKNGIFYAVRVTSGMSGEVNYSTIGRRPPPVMERPMSPRSVKNVNGNGVSSQYGSFTGYQAPQQNGSNYAVSFLLEFSDALTNKRHASVNQ